MSAVQGRPEIRRDYLLCSTFRRAACRMAVFRSFRLAIRRSSDRGIRSRARSATVIGVFGLSANPEEMRASDSQEGLSAMIVRDAPPASPNPI